ncbi:MAG: hypothetical protein JJU28_15185 [Cyclobacteriaceae bacterium]|nr:hypothetical protein [Cyclobacteriaceae bacterium]
MKSSNLSILLVTLLFFAAGCSFQSENKAITQNSDTTFSLIMENENVIILNGKQTSLLSLDAELQVMIDSLQGLNLNKEDITISIHANKTINMGSITDMQAKLRSNGISRLTYQSL